MEIFKDVYNVHVFLLLYRCPKLNVLETVPAISSTGGPRNRSCVRRHQHQTQGDQRNRATGIGKLYHSHQHLWAAYHQDSRGE